jgi:hypothetical protein
MSDDARAIAIVCCIVVAALGAVCGLWFWIASAKTAKHHPQIWCDDIRQRQDGYGGWPLCELKLFEA